jgi:hypothetical protein
MAGEGLPVQMATRVLGISEPGYYHSRGAPPSARAYPSRLAAGLDPDGARGLERHLRHRHVHAELRLGQGIVVGHNAVEMLMARAEISG